MSSAVRKSRRRNQDTMISFLDIICCGFGAIVLLMVIVRPSQPILLEESLIQDKGQVRTLQERLFEIRGQIDYLEKELNAKQEQLGAENTRVAILRTELATLQAQQASVDDFGADDTTSAADLQIALQKLSKEMRRLLRGRNYNKEYVAGIPVDSEYVIFIVDTSGSMRQSAWNRLTRELRNVLRIYPKVEGIQVMTSDGRYMFPGSRGKFMQDGAAVRRDIYERLPSWLDVSSSSPVGGIYEAIETHYDADKKISLYVFGDDFTGRSVRRVLEAVRKINKQRSGGETLVRIHAVGFPVEYYGGGGNMSRFGNLMRELANENNGSFIGLSHVR